MSQTAIEKLAELLKQEEARGLIHFTMFTPPSADPPSVEERAQAIVEMMTHPSPDVLLSFGS